MYLTRKRILMEILPIDAVVYNQEKVNMDDVTAPPYDVIDEKYQDELYKRSDFNIVRLILAKGENKYEEAKETYTKWQEDKILIPTEKPSVFYIIQKYL